MDRKTRKIVEGAKQRLQDIAHGLCQKPVDAMEKYRELVGEYRATHNMLEQILSGEKEDDDE